MPRYSDSLKPNETLGSKYALSRTTRIKTDSAKLSDDIYSAQFHVSTSLKASKEWFKQQKMIIKNKRILFEDPIFPATDSSLFFSQRPKQNCEWKRPKEICTKPMFMADGATRFDIRQGEIGDCWFLAAVTSLCMHQNLFVQIVPEDQEFNQSDYVGAFMFRFWKFGTWVDVVVDDRLPTVRNRLIYLHSTDPNEFWSALLEKAYAKMASSYEALKGGSSSEAMEDFTGGITEIFELGATTPPNLWDTIERANSLSSLMGCSVEGSGKGTEGKGQFGLITGHAYSITDSELVATRRGKVKLIRVRNPWGNEYEWTGAWSDKSKEWNDVSKEERDRIQLAFSDDGEFWMNFDDFAKYFTKLEICHLSPDAEMKPSANRKKLKWQMCIENAEWQKNVSAGGCRNFLDTFHMNPQFRVDITEPDIAGENTGTVIIGLMQKEMRSRRKEGQDFYTIGYVIYSIKGSTYENSLLNTQFFRSTQSVAKSPAFVNSREICGRHKLPLGKYVIVPSTFNPGEEAKFLLRIFSEKPYDSRQMDQKTEILEPNWNRDSTDGPSKEDNAAVQRLRDAFMDIASGNHEIDANMLQTILDSAFKHESFTFKGFSRETCRSLVALMDTDQSGKLGFDEFKIMWDDLRLWKTIFKTFDVDKSGSLNSFEIRQALDNIGFRISNRVFTAIATRYSDQDGIIEFDDYILLLARLKTIFLTYKSQKKTPTGDAIFPRDDFIQCVLYM